MKHKLPENGSPFPLKMRRLNNGFAAIDDKECGIKSLLDLSAKVVAAHLPFEYVDKMLVHIPEPVQEKIIYYSFPQRDSDIYTYASFHSKADKGREKIPYYEGLEYFQNDCVENVIQIGFHLTGSVKHQHSCVSSDNELNKYEVSITFDRCKIISVCCDCGNKGLSWCPHVVALALFRIRQPQLVDYRSPISDALVRMNRSQLQKFAQYLIASHPNKVLPSAQQLADELLQPESSINKTSGAPDPTAGASVEDVAAWYLDEAGVREQLRVELANLATAGSGSVSGTNSSYSSNNNIARGVSGRPSSPSLVVTTVNSSRSLEPSRVNGIQSQLSNTVNLTNSAAANENAPGSPPTDIGLNWLMRYRRLVSDQTSMSHTTLDHPISSESNHLLLTNLNLLSDAGIDWLPFSPLRFTCARNESIGFHCSSYGVHNAGAQITAMFAKVRELLAKRDSNGPRLLSLITEELLRCPKLPLLKARRSHRSMGIELAGRMHMPGSLRNSPAYQNVPSDPFLPSANPNYSNSNSAQLPPWTVRLWDEVCILWTCVVLNPDCSPEARRQWRTRFISWAHAHRCPRDETYYVPSHYFTTLHDHLDSEEDTSSRHSSQQSQIQSQNRQIRRATVFQLPIEVSFMSWDDEWLRHFLGFETKKREKCEPYDYDDSRDISVELDDEISLLSSFRRPRSTTPRRTPAGHSSPSNTLRNCHCPYCDYTTPLNESFPLLCLRIAALRSNGYLDQALRLGVFISQRLLRAFKSRVTSTINALMPPNSRSPTQLSPHLVGTWGAGDGMIRRSLFPGPGSRSTTPLPYGSPPYSSVRYHPVPSMLSPPSAVPNQSKFSSSNRLPSPRPSSISPPISVTHHRPGSRRHGMSPCGSSASGPLMPGQSNWNVHGTCLGPPSYAYKAYPPHFFTPPQPFTPNSHLPHHPGSACSATSSFHQPFQPAPPSCPPLSIQSSTHSYLFNPAPYANGPTYQPGPVATSNCRPQSSTRLAGRALANSPGFRYPIPSHVQINNATTNDLIHFGVNSSVCPCHTDTGWIGLPGRPLICLIECLLDAAALVVESSYRQMGDPLNRMESACFYLCLSLKVSLITLCQQRRVCGSPSRLLASQTQESKLIALLGTMPKDVPTVMSVCETMSILLGPPVVPRGMVRQELNPTFSTAGCLSSWWWSALGSLVHPDSYPVHGVAQFVLDYVLDAQKRHHLTYFNTCWNPPIVPAVTTRIDDLLYAIVTRAMRLSVSEPSSDLNISVSNRSVPHYPSAPPRFPPQQRMWGNAHSLDPETALAVNTDMNDSVMGAENSAPIDPHTVNQSVYHPTLSRSTRTLLDTDYSHVIANSYPPFPSAFASAVQTSLRIPPECNGHMLPNILTCCPPPAYMNSRASSSVEVAQSSSLFANQNMHLKRCLEVFELRQVHLAVSLVRISKSHLHRLDQAVQIFDRHVHSATGLLAISQQIFAEAVGLEPRFMGPPKCGGLHICNASLLTNFHSDVCGLHSDGSSTNHLPTSSTQLNSSNFVRERINLISCAYHLALLVVLRTFTTGTMHWRRREVLAWAVTIGLHVGPSACLHLLTHWATYVSPREAVNCLAPALLAFINRSACNMESAVAHGTKSSGPLKANVSASCTGSDPSVCLDHALLFGLVNSQSSSTGDPLNSDELSSVWPPWYGITHSAFAPRHHATSITLAAQFLSSTVPYSITSREHISSSVRNMAMQAASKDPVNCALPAITLTERNTTAFDAVYRLVLHSAETGALGPVQLFSLARYMDGRGWAWRAFPFALHATRLFILSTMQDSHPVVSDVLWACSLAHRLGPGALQEILNHVIRNIHCPTLLTDILHRCRMYPSGIPMNSMKNHEVGLPTGTNCSNHLTVGLKSCPIPFSGTPTYPLSSNPTACNGKLLSLDRPPLKGLLEAAINAFVVATHTRLSNISPRQYSEFVDFLSRARDTFHLLRPDGPSQFSTLVECLRQTYRGKRKLVSLLAERFG